MNLIDYELVSKNFATRDVYAHKGNFGTTLMIVGSYSMAGAAIISSRANILSGVGICNIYCPQSIYPIVAGGVPEAIFTPYTKPLEKLEKALNKASCVVIGCGMGQCESTKQILQFVLENSTVPVIVDADGLNCLSRNMQWLKNSNAPIILTPHLKEMSRLCKKSVEEILQNRVNISAQFVKEYNVTLVLKGYNTLVTFNDGTQFVNISGNAGMATGGSGDMLCGIMGALCSYMPLDKAVTSSVFIHGAAGDVCAAEYSQTSTCPTLMLEMLPKIYKKLEKD